MLRRRFRLDRYAVGDRAWFHTIVANDTVAIFFFYYYFYFLQSLSESFYDTARLGIEPF